LNDEPVARESFQVEKKAQSLARPYKMEGFNKVEWLITIG
jgi:hypothetical protein